MRRERSIALAAYALLAFGFFGVRLLVDGGTVYPGIGVDPQIFTWSFAWWPHAILHGENPIYSHVVWAPDGVDLAWATTVPGLALAFTPLTLLVGPLASYDTAAVLMPALAAWTAFLLCRHLTRNFWASLAGGYVFGFSSYMLGQFQGHLHLTSVFLLPLVALVCLRFLEGGLGARGLAWRLGLLLALQVSFSTEVAFTLTLAIVASIVLAFALVPAVRARVVSLLVPVAGAYAFAAVLISPFLWYLLTDFHRGTINSIGPADLFGLDLANLVVPTRLSLGGGWAWPLSRHFLSGWTEGGGYLGLPALVAVVWSFRRSRFLAAAFLVTLVASFGTYLRVRGHELAPMPWEHVGYWPLFNQILPVRLSVYLALIAAIAVALFAAARTIPVWARIAVPALAIVFLLPDLGLSTWATKVHEPTFITDGLYKHCITKNENVLALPFGQFGDSMLWQAQTGFWFRQAGGYLGPVPPQSFQSLPVAVYGQPGPLEPYVLAKHVSAIVVDEQTGDDWSTFVSRLGKPERVGGVAIYGSRCTD
jgi:hypothetical protein